LCRKLASVLQTKTAAKFRWSADPAQLTVPAHPLKPGSYMPEPEGSTKPVLGSMKMPDLGHGGPVRPYRPSLGDRGRDAASLAILLGLPVAGAAGIAGAGYAAGRAGSEGTPVEPPVTPAADPPAKPKPPVKPPVKTPVVPGAALEEPGMLDQAWSYAKENPWQAAGIGVAGAAGVAGAVMLLKKLLSKNRDE
jgi:hypothetical protein